jgi:hypothetical protein
MLVALSPWQPPAVPAERFEPHVMQQCTEASVRRSLAAVHEPPKPKPKAIPMVLPGDEIKPPTIRRGPAPEALIALGATMLVAGSAMRFPAPIYMEVTPEADPWREPAARAAYTSYTHPPRQLALGTVGTVFQAVGAGLLRRGIQSR